MRELLPPLLALSANSPFLDHRDTGLHSVRTEIFTRTFPRCGVHEPFGDWATYADFVRLLSGPDRSSRRPSSGGASGPHHAFGTVEVRVCDAQTRGDESLNLAALIAACVAQAALDYDERGYGAGPPLGQREIEENLWRAIRYGMDGEMIDFDAAEDRADPGACSRDCSSGPSRPASALGVDVELPEENGAQRARARARRGGADRGDLPAGGRGDPADLRARGQPSDGRDD